MKKKLYFSIIGSIIFFSLIAQNALHFDGINDKVDIGNGTALQITGTAITIEAWIYPNSWKTNVWEGGIVVKEQNSVNNGYMFRAGNNGQLNFSFGANGGAWTETFSTTGSLSLNQWQHVAATYDGSTVRLYKNGVQIATKSATASIGNASNNCFIGGYYGTSRNFHGKIDEVRIWNVARSANDIMSAMNGEFCGAVSGLMAYYKLNQGNAGGTNAGLTTATNSVGPNGTLQNFTLSGNTSNWVAGKSLSTPVGGTGTDTVLTCDTYLSPSGNHVWTQSGNYIDTILSPLGCDSIININLTVNESTTGTTSVTKDGCNSVKSPSGKYTWITSGTYNDTVTNTAGCDSALIVNLTIKTIDTNVLQNGTTLTSWQNGATYQWLDCDNGFVPMWGATGQTFVPPFDGHYAVEVSKDGCTDTSACYQVTGIGVSEDIKNGFSLHPNPATDEVRITFLYPQVEVSVEIIDAIGQQILKKSFMNKESINLKINTKPGVYFIRVMSKEYQSVQRLIIK